MLLERDTALVYSCDNSSVEGTLGQIPDGPRRFLNVWNQHTQEFAQLGGLPDTVPWEQLFQRFYVDNPKKLANGRRGNLQENFGFASGNNWVRRTPENIRKHYGCNVPAMLDGTMDPMVVRTMVAMSDLARKVGVSWSDTNFLGANESDRKRIELFAQSIDPSNLWELISVCFFPVGPHGKVKPHCDSQNCPRLKEVLISSRIMRAPDGS